MTASFAVGGRAAGAELIDLAVEVADGIFTIPLDPPPAGIAEGRVTVRVRDRQGNEMRVDRRFRLIGSGTEPTPTSAPTASTTATAVATPSAPNTPETVPATLYLPWAVRRQASPGAPRASVSAASR